MKNSRICIGISGWTYDDWRGSFYPDGLAIKNELKYASGKFNSIEVNGTFYGLQRPHTFEKWYLETLENFCFALKAPKYVTHERRLKDVATPIANFFASGVLALREKLGPILWQLPPHLPLDMERMEIFLDLLPRSTKDAGKQAKKHSSWMKGRTMLKADADRPLLHAVEVRHHSYATPEFLDLMRQHQIAIVIGDTAGRWPLIKEQTSNLIYIRLHGDETVYPRGYTKTALKAWAKDIAAYSKHVPNVFAFCDNDHKTAAPANALQLMQLTGVQWKAGLLLKPTTNDRTVGKTTRKSRAKN